MTRDNSYNLTRVIERQLDVIDFSRGALRKNVRLPSGVTVDARVHQLSERFFAAEFEGHTVLAKVRRSIWTLRKALHVLSHGSLEAYTLEDLQLITSQIDRLLIFQLTAV